jgi:peptide/nickel transport system substrate-binding protein
LNGVEVVKTSTPFLFLLLAPLAAGCPRKETPPADAAVPAASSRPDAWPPLPQAPGRRGGILSVRLRAEPAHLNLLIQPDQILARVTLHQIFETLLREDPRTYALSPALAESWQLSSDRRTLTLRLRQGVRWHDGRPFGAADVKLTLDTVLDPTSPATALRANLKALSSVDVAGEGVVVLRYREPHYHAIHALTSIPILPRHVYGAGDLRTHPANRAPVGTGPFRFESWAAGAEIRLARFEGYWGRPAWLDAIRYRLVREDAVALALVRRGDLDVDERAGNDEWLQAAGDANLRSRVRRLLLYPPGYAFRVYNTRLPPLADRRVRLALTLLTDRPSSIREVHRGLHRPAVSHYPAESPCHAPGLTAHPFDPTRAGALLTAAGFSEARPLRLTWLIPTTSKTLVPEARIFQTDARRAGVHVALETVDWPSFLSRLRAGKFEMAALSWTTAVEDDPYAIFHSSQGQDGLNYGAFQSADLDRLLTALRAEFDPRKRRELCRGIERLLHEEQPYTFLYQLAAPHLVTRRLAGIYPSLLGLQYREAWLGP